MELILNLDYKVWMPKIRLDEHPQEIFGMKALLHFILCAVDFFLKPFMGDKQGCKSQTLKVLIIF